MDQAAPQGAEMKTLSKDDSATRLETDVSCCGEATATWTEEEERKVRRKIDVRYASVHTLPVKDAAQLNNGAGQALTFVGGLLWPPAPRQGLTDQCIGPGDFTRLGGSDPKKDKPCR